MVSDQKLLVILCIAIGVLLVLLLVVTALLLRSQKNKTQATGKRRRRSLAKGPDVNAAVQEEEIDITRMTPFAVVPAAQLPKLSAAAEEDADDDRAARIEESKALLHFESNAWLGIDEPTGPAELIVTAAAGQTDRGVTRRRNEDSFLVDPGLELYVVADGMGGYAGGDVASRLAVTEVRGFIQSGETVEEPTDRPRRGRELIAAIERANAAVYAESRKDKTFHGMGTTIVAARFSLRKQRVYIGYVGDSRCYRFRGGELKLLSTDHTLGARGVTGPLAGNLRRALGVAPTVKVDLVVDKPWPEDIYLLCSDGLNRMLGDDAIGRTLADERDMNRAVSQLILGANAKGGRDNITVILIRVEEVTLSRGWKAGDDATARA